MLFHSLGFLLFLPLVAWLHHLLPHRFRWILLLGASYWFYAAWKIEYLPLIMVSTLVDYLAGLRMGSLPDRRSRRPTLLLAVAINFGLLAFFKYATFAIDLFRQSLELLPSLSIDASQWPTLQILLPIGISFYTFQTIGYSIDVYRGKIQPERHLGIFAVYVSFFPQLVAGPIERAKNLIPQFHRQHRIEPQQLSTGLLLILWGLFKKLVVADRIAALVGPVYENPESYAQAVTAAAPLAYLYQIYCDFSGYTDIARGSALIMGFQLVRNFRRPFTALTMTEFWQRWHMSLGTWIRDYVFLPLSRSSKGRTGRLLSVLFVAILFGLWHGAGMNFFVFGFLMGTFMILEQATKRARRRFAHVVEKQWVPWSHEMPMGHHLPGQGISRVLGHLYMMAALWLCLVFFFPQPVWDGILLIKAALIPEVSGEASLPLALSWSYGAFLVACVILVELGEILREKTVREEDNPLPLSGWRYAAVTYLLILGILLFGRFTSVPYVYFQF